MVAACASSDPGEFPENHAIDVETSVEDDECCPRRDGDETEEELICDEVSLRHYVQAANLLDPMIEIKTVYGHTKILTAQLSKCISCGGRMEYHAMVYEGGDKCPW